MNRPPAFASCADCSVACDSSTRCPYAVDVCAKEPPALEELASGHFVSCHRARELSLPGISEVS
jgi:ABC-type dipeptide/oligopeptide/nickel transport system ATPase component